MSRLNGLWFEYKTRLNSPQKKTKHYERPALALIGENQMSFRVCIACYGIRVYPYVGFMTGQRYQCQDCLELMVIPIEFDEEKDYRDFVTAVKGESE